MHSKGRIDKVHATGNKDENMIDIGLYWRFFSPNPRCVFVRLHAGQQWFCSVLFVTACFVMKKILLGNSYTVSSTGSADPDDYRQDPVLYEFNVKWEGKIRKDKDDKENMIRKDGERKVGET
jgi:hypothetical protein